jgi:hypothetical protein
VRVAGQKLCVVMTYVTDLLPRMSDDNIWHSMDGGPAMRNSITQFVIRVVVVLGIAIVGVVAISGVVAYSAVERAFPNGTKTPCPIRS